MVLAQERPITLEPYASARRRARPRPAVHRGQVWLLCLLVFTFICGLILVFAHGQVAVIGYRLTNLQCEVAALAAENGTLEAALSELDSLDRVERVATSRLGMVRPGQADVLYVALDTAGQEGSGSSQPGPRSQESTPCGEAGVIQALMELVFRPGEGISPG
ncbi:MAG: hypothetical protein ACUVRC_08060 [Desulfotomaculales bacterium]